MAGAVPVEGRPDMEQLIGVSAVDAQGAGLSAQRTPQALLLNLHLLFLQGSPR